MNSGSGMRRGSRFPGRVGLLRKVHDVATLPISIFFILSSKRIHPAYRMTRLRKANLGLRMFFNSRRIPTGTSHRCHLATALKLFETPPETPGDVIECGTWKGGSAANLSLVCRIVGRKLRVFDSFQGLPKLDPRDREAPGYQMGDYLGTLDEVKANVSRFGAIECCEFVEGWFEDTLPTLSDPVLLAFLDVDLEASLDTCVKNIWPNLVDGGYIFTDESVGTDYTALFYSERWWKLHFGQTPPGLIGAGSGLPLGEYYVGPWSENADHPLHHASTGAYTRKGMSGYWSYYPGDESPQDAHP